MLFFSALYVGFTKKEEKIFMNVLITGIAGLIGSNLADWIIQNKPNVNIIGIDDFSGGYRENINPKVEFYQFDLMDKSADKLFDEYRFDAVYHFAAYAAEGLSPFMRSFNYKNNLITTAKLITLSITYDIRRFIFTSSLAVYGRGKAPFDEKDTPQPIDPYGVAKFACEMDLKIAKEQHGLDYCIIRPHNVYGPNQNIWDKYRNVLGIWMNSHLNWKPISVFGDGEQIRAFSYIEDCLEPFWKAGTEPVASAQIINLGGKIEWSINDAANVLIDVMGGGKIEHLEARHEVKDAWPTWQKSEDILNYKGMYDYWKE